MKKQAFSLIELIIVILFLGILSVIAVLAVNSIYKEGAKKSEETTNRMIVLMIEDYLIEDFTTTDCTADATTLGYPYTCELTVLKNKGYIKAEVCNKADNRKIDLVATKFTVVNPTGTENQCEDCAELELINLPDSCSDIQLEGE